MLSQNFRSMIQCDVTVTSADRWLLVVVVSLALLHFALVLLEVVVTPPLEEAALQRNNDVRRTATRDVMLTCAPSTG